MSAAPYFSQQRQSDAGGEYRLLYKYLHDRFADRLVLTFGQIEDLIGFSLPEPARVQCEWWGGSEAMGWSKHSDAWTLAGRTATVNLSAQCVIFERERSWEGRT